ncbi:MAG: oxygen-independent coproporphyrinogen III oxidase [Alphaproteobacteria bacterium]|nr:oxygen-independent coproporphyrinogen III oxidase [Alphaproteobacteria bacterium]
MTETDLADKSLDFWLDRAVPRYTSYPPAPAFHEAVGATAYAASLAKIAPGDPVSLYLHIPFCRELCLYCGCNTAITHRNDRIGDYVKALQKEIVQTLALIPHRPKIAAVHWGGGTPNILSDKAMREIFSILGEMCDLGTIREIAMEMDPRRTNQQQIELLAACGVNRVSLGVQDFNPDVQKLVHRIQPAELVEKTVATLRTAGIAHVNFDLIYGLPLQTPDSVAETARQVCTLRPSRVALFSYAHVPQIKKHQAVLEEAGLPGKYARLAMDDAARVVLRAAGYREIGMDHFALPGDALEQATASRNLHRNFQGYTTDASPVLLGFGASSIGSTADGFFQNERLLPAYQKTVGEGRSPVVRGVLTTPEDRVRGAIIEELMCYLDCDVAAVCERMNFSIDRFEKAFALLHEMERHQLIELNGAKIRLLSPHRMSVRVVCNAFDAYAPASVASRAA